MKDLNYIHYRLDKIYYSMNKNINDKHKLEIFRKYTEKHRYYHNIEHILDLLNKADNLSDNLFLAILYHDVIYCPFSNTNEEDSASFFMSEFSDLVYSKEVEKAILETKNHKPTSELSNTLCELDLSILNGSLSKFIEFENKIFKEYQFVDYSIYLEHRVNILEKLGCKHIDYVKVRKPTIAIYPGSFNPLHIGHLNIIEKAEKIFDKVVIAKGNNPEKEISKISFQNEKIQQNLKYHQIINYNGLFSECLSNLNYKPIIIRGLRNSKDFDYEEANISLMREIGIDNEVFMIVCDEQYRNISSSKIREINKYNPELGKELYYSYKPKNLKK